MAHTAPFDPSAEFDRQLHHLVDLGYPALTGITPHQFRERLSPLRAQSADLTTQAPDTQAGHVPFLLVPARTLAPIEPAMTLTRLHRGNKPGFVDRSYEPGALERFVDTQATALPTREAHLVLDLERGEEFCDVAPSKAVDTITERDRTPLTIEEGLALITQFPEVLVKNKCFSLGGSRSGDKRVPALWISQRAPKLGWCWQGNPHTWLGMASASTRTAP